MRIHKQSNPRYKSRLNSDSDSVISFVLLLCSSSLSESELSLRSRRSLILFLVLIACSLVSLSLTCNKVSLHFRVVRPGMWQRQLTRQDTRPKNSLHTRRQRSRERQLWDNLFCSGHTTLTGLNHQFYFSFHKIISVVNIIFQAELLLWKYNLLAVKC